MLIPAGELTGLMETAHLLRSPANASRLVAALERLRSGEGRAMTTDELKITVGL